MAIERSKALAILGPAFMLSGCVAAAAAGAAVSATGTVVETTVNVGGAAVGAAVDVVTPGDDEADD